MPGVSKRIVDLSRNLLVIVCEYLTYIEIVHLICANKRIFRKLDGDVKEKAKAHSNDVQSIESVSYVKRRGTIFFQSFFFQQFPGSEAFLKRLMQLTTPIPKEVGLFGVSNSEIKNLMDLGLEGSLNQANSDS
jgi:hypothetical protein